MDGLVDQPKISFSSPEPILCNFVKHLVSIVLQSVIQGVMEAVEFIWKAEEQASEGEVGVTIAFCV